MDTPKNAAGAATERLMISLFSRLSRNRVAVLSTPQYNRVYGELYTALRECDKGAGALRDRIAALEAELAAFRAHEEQAHRILGGILGDDTSLEDAARRMRHRAEAAEAELIAEQATAERIALHEAQLEDELRAARREVEELRGVLGVYLRQIESMGEQEGRFQGEIAALRRERAELRARLSEILALDGIEPPSCDGSENVVTAVHDALEALREDRDTARREVEELGTVLREARDVVRTETRCGCGKLRLSGVCAPCHMLAAIDAALEGK